MFSYIVHSNRFSINAVEQTSSKVNRTGLITECVHVNCKTQRSYRGAARNTAKVVSTYSCRRGAKTRRGFVESSSGPLIVYVHIRGCPPGCCSANGRVVPFGLRRKRVCAKPFEDDVISR